ncbi:MAG: glycosyltransferase family 2 protein [Bdellovibrionales bacterium]|nr:glycosyltransferase family 2 protein [Bdellovibrionales bacterium]
MTSKNQPLVHEPESKDSREATRALLSRWLEQQQPLGESPEISVVIPAFNEEWRLPPTLIDVIDFFDNSGRTYEIVVVDDGSRDSTSAVVKKFSRVRSQVRLLRIPRNSGKGYAIRSGVQNAKGHQILFADADGSTPISEYNRLAKALENSEIAIGSRALRSEEVSVRTSLHRRALGRVFNLLVNQILLPDFRDTQCGFKLFRAPVARFLFHLQQSDGFSFDCEILYLAKRAQFSIAEVPVNWVNVPGSKVNLVLDSMKMLRDLFIFRMRHRNISHRDFETFLVSENLPPQANQEAEP